MCAGKDAVPNERGGGEDLRPESRPWHDGPVSIRTLSGVLLACLRTLSIKSHYGIMSSALRIQGQWH
jgi:hypothetical protein